METQLESIQEIKRLIGKNQQQKALEKLAEEKLPIPDKQIFMLKSRFNKIKHEQRLGIINENDARIELNKVNNDILDLLEDVANKLKKKYNSPRNNQQRNRKNLPVLIGIFALIIIIVSGSIWYNNEMESNRSSSSTNNLDAADSIQQNVPNKQEEHKFLLAQADSLYEVGRFEKALILYEQIKDSLEINIQDQVSQKIKSCQDEIKFKTLCDEGKKHEDKKEYKDALEKYKKASQIKRSDKSVTAAKERLEKIIYEAELEPWESKFLENYVYLKDKGSGKFLSVLNPRNQSKPQLDDFQKNATRLFKIKRRRKGVYVIECKMQSQQIITAGRADDGSYSKFSPLWTWEYAAGKGKPGGNQNWKIIQDGDKNAFFIQNTNSELFMGIEKSSGKLYQLAKGERITWEIYTESEMDN